MGRKNDRPGYRDAKKQNIPKDTDWNKMFGIPKGTASWKEKTEQPVDRKKSFQARIAVAETPTVREHKGLIEEYPEDAVILSIGPASNGKTEKMKELFGEDKVCSFNDLVYKKDGKTRLDLNTQRKKKKAREEAFKQLDQIIEVAQGPIVIDANSCLEEFRARIYEAVKKAGKTIFIITYSIPLKQAKEGIENKYKEGMEELEQQIEEARAKGEDTTKLEEEAKKLTDINKKRHYTLKATYDDFVKTVPVIENEIQKYGMKKAGFSQVRRIKGNRKQGKNQSETEGLDR